MSDDCLGFLSAGFDVAGGPDGPRCSDRCSASCV